MAIDTAQVLTINPGVRIHFHRGSSLLVFGTLQVNGTVEEPVTFQGDRLEKMYEDLPGQWGSWVEYDNGSAYILGGIHITPPSRDNVINHAIIKNAIKGIQVDTLSNTERPMLTITNSRIENMTVAGIYAQSTTIRSEEHTSELQSLDSQLRILGRGFDTGRLLRVLPLHLIK
jgi:hypothetical protein